jgi:hypothetical protein
MVATSSQHSVRPTSLWTETETKCDVGTLVRRRDLLTQQVFARDAQRNLAFAKLARNFGSREIGHLNILKA